MPPAAIVLQSRWPDLLTHQCCRTFYLDTLSGAPPKNYKSLFQSAATAFPEREITLNETKKAFAPAAR